MNAAMVTGMLKKGACVVGEFRGCTPETVKYVDKKTGQATHFNQALYRVELESGGIPVTLSVGFEDGQEVALPKFARGDVVCAVVQSLDVKRGVYSGRIDVRAGGIVKVS